MARPLMQSRIGELENLFEASNSNLDVLHNLVHELQFRQVPRALALLERVQRAQAAFDAGKTAPPLPSPRRHIEVIERSPPSTPSMSIDDAYRLLNVTPGAGWETIEQARRATVQKSSPLVKDMPYADRVTALEKARLVNAAYEALAMYSRFAQ